MKGHTVPGLQSFAQLLEYFTLPPQSTADPILPQYRGSMEAVLLQYYLTFLTKKIGIY
jgi:hypothetical protein